MDRDEFLAGLRDIAPAVPSGVPFGMLFGATAVQVGIDPAAATAMSVFTFAAVAQLAAVDLLRGGTSLPVTLATILLINLRYVIFSASLAPKVRHLPARWRAVIAFPLMDVTYAFAEARFDDPGGHPGWYYLGVSVPMFLTFTISTLAGAFAGLVVGEGLHLDFVIPLLFIAILVPQLEDRPALLAAAGAGLVAVLAAELPLNLGLLLAVLVGTAVGAIGERPGAGVAR